MYNQKSYSQELYHELDEKLRLEKRIADLKSAIAG